MGTSPRDSEEQVFPPNFSFERGVTICKAQLGLTRSQSLVALYLVTLHRPVAVAEKLNCAHGTIKTHLRAIGGKLAVRNCTGIVAVVLAAIWRGQCAV